MTVGKVSFKGVEAPTPQPQEQTKVSFKGQESPIDEQKSNATKYMIGATALAGVVALGIAGYKGHLGEGIQKFLGGAKKAAGEAGKAIEKEGAKAASAGSKVEKLTAEELAKIGEKNIKVITDEEVKRILATLVPDEEPVLRAALEKIVKVVKSDPNAEGKISELTRRVPVLRRWARIKFGQDGVEKMLGQHSPAFKKINELKLGDFIDIIPQKGIAQLSEERVSSLSMLDKNIKIVDLIEQSGVKLSEGIDTNTSLIDNIEKVMRMRI